MHRHHHHHGDPWERVRFAREAFGFGRGHGLGREAWAFAGREHGGRRGRLFDHGDLKLVILALIAEQPSHGYEMIKAIEERLGGAYSPSPGVVYPTLTLLEELGYATVESAEGGRKLYAITDKGREFLDENRASIDAIQARMSEARARRGDVPPTVLRAMENLKTALKLKHARGPLTDAQAQRVAEALDAAALAIDGV